MMDRRFICTIARFHRKDPLTFVIQGYFRGNSIAGSRMEAYLDSRSLPLQITSREGLLVRQKYFAAGDGREEIDREYDLCVKLPADFEKGRALKLFQTCDDKRSCVYACNVRRLKKERTMPDGYLETFRREGKTVYVGGWAVGNSPCRITVTDGRGRVLKSETEWFYRKDIAGNYPELLNEMLPEENEYGYEVSFEAGALKRVNILVSATGQEQIFSLNVKKGIPSQSKLKKAVIYYKRNGFARTAGKIAEKIRERGSGKEPNYMNWRVRHLPSREELEAQRKSEFRDAPLISIVVPLYHTPPELLMELAASVRDQTYGNWELCLSDGSGNPDELKCLLEKLSREDPRIKYTVSDKPLGISENTNAAIGISGGSWIAFADHDDLLEPFALYECVKRLYEEPEAELVYSDEDKVSLDGKTFFQPHFKTDYNIDLLCSMNYICHLTVVSRDLANRSGFFRKEYDGAQDYDFILRCAENAKKVSHIPKVLYHWRSHMGSTSENPESKRYAFEAGMRAVQAHYDRLGIPALVREGEYPGLYITTYIMPEDPPLVSIIIPNKDHVQDLDRCLFSIFKKVSYPNLEILIVENNSAERETFSYYKQIVQGHENVRVLEWKEGFNYSKINNFGAAEAKGEYLLFLNNDTQVIAKDLIEQLLGPALRDEVGAVGARLFYEDNTIQHAGVVIGYGGIAGHAFQGMSGKANGYFSRIICQSDVSAVTAACMLVKRSVFEEAGGFEETLAVAFNDIDLCLKIRSLGKLVVYNPAATMYHYESKSRGMEDTPGKIARFNKEADLFLGRWPQILKDGDPFYNPNLSLDRNDFALK